MADVNAGLHLDEEYRNLYNVLTAKAMARSVAVLSGVLIATVPLVLAFFPCASFLFVFPHWAMALLFVAGGSVCATGIYFPLKSILISALNRHSKNVWSNGDLLHERNAVVVSPSSSVDVAEEAEVVGPLHEFTIGISTKVAFMDSVFFSSPMSIIYVGSEVKKLFVKTDTNHPLFITKDLMKNRLR
ncbi:MAG: hypothetical protein LBG86_00005, partial [Puniceicoccales bacterium]|nr:hypothetical protein [Puniceicoccales bacterium]